MRGIDRSEGLRLLFLTSKGLDNVHAGDVLLNKFVHAADLIAHVDEGFFDDALKNARRQQQHRNGRQDE